MLFTQYVVHINSVSQYLLGGVHLLFTYYSNRTKSREKSMFPTNQKALSIKVM